MFPQCGSYLFGFSLPRKAWCNQENKKTHVACQPFDVTCQPFDVLCYPQDKISMKTLKLHHSRVDLSEMPPFILPLA